MFILDFDGTLFDTHLFVEDIYTVLEAAGISREACKATMKSCILLGENERYGYNFKKQIAALQQMDFTFNTEKILAQLNALLNNNDYTSEDTLSFLETIKQYNLPMELLTAGHDDFQMKKYHSTKIPAYLNKASVVHGHKEQFVASVINQHKQIFFINDKVPENNVVKEQFPQVSVITKHNPYKIVGKGEDTLGLPTFTTLTEIADYVATIIN